MPHSLPHATVGENWLREMHWTGHAKYARDWERNVESEAAGTAGPSAWPWSSPAYSRLVRDIAAAIGQNRLTVAKRLLADVAVKFSRAPDLSRLRGAIRYRKGDSRAAKDFSDDLMQRLDFADLISHQVKLHAAHNFSYSPESIKNEAISVREYSVSDRCLVQFAKQFDWPIEQFKAFNGLGHGPGQCRSGKTRDDRRSINAAGR